MDDHALATLLYTKHAHFSNTLASCRHAASQMAASVGVPPLSRLASAILDGIDLQLQETYVDMLQTLYRMPGVEGSLCEPGNLWEDKSWLEYESLGRVEEALGMNPEGLGEEDEDADLGSEFQSTESESAPWIGNSSAGANKPEQTRGISVKSRLSVVKEEEEDDQANSDDINSVIFSYLSGVSTPKPKHKTSTDSLAKFLKTTGPREPEPIRTFSSQSGTVTTTTSTDAKEKKNKWWRLNPKKSKENKSPKNKTKRYPQFGSVMSPYYGHGQTYDDPYGKNYNHRDRDLIGADKRAMNEGVYDPQRLAEEGRQRQQARNDNVDRFHRNLVSPSQFGDPNEDDRRVSVDFDFASMATDDLALTEVGNRRQGEYERRRSLGVGVLLNAAEEALREGIAQRFKEGAIPIYKQSEENGRKIEKDKSLSPAEKEEDMKTLADSTRFAIRRLAEETGYDFIDNDAFVRTTVELQRQAVERMGRVSPTKQLKKVLSKTWKTTAWFLSVPTDEDLHSDTVYLPKIATQSAFPNALSVQPKTPTPSASRAGSSAEGVGRQNSSRRARSRSDAETRRANTATPREARPSYDSEATYVGGGGGEAEGSKASTTWPTVSEVYRPGRGRDVEDERPLPPIPPRSERRGNTPFSANYQENARNRGNMF